MGILETKVESLIFRNPELKEHHKRAASSHLLQVLQELGLMLCHRYLQLLPHSSGSHSSLEMLYHKRAAFVFRELLMLTLLSWCLSRYRTDLSHENKETPCRATRRVLLGKETSLNAKSTLV